MTKEEIQTELDKSLARIDGSFDDIKNEITKPFDDILGFIEEKPIVAVGTAVLLGLVVSSVLSRNSSSTQNSLDRSSAESLIEAGISNREAGMSVDESIDSAIRNTPVQTVNYARNIKSGNSNFLTTLFGSKVGKQLAQALFKNGLNLLNNVVQDRIKKH